MLEYIHSAKLMPCYSPLKGWRCPLTGGIVFKRPSGAVVEMCVACSQCLGCRLDHSRMWMVRCVHEASLWDDNCFITLTYRPKELCTAEQLAKGWHVPNDGSLNKKHFQDFMKRLRKKFSDIRIRYYHCGEYGDQLDRPHYHACLFNFDFSDKELFKQSEGYALFVSKTLEQLWPYGFSTVGELTAESAAYCARYILKKVNGNGRHEHYLRVDEYGVAYWLQEEYVTMSRRPGIGRGFYEKFESDFFPRDEVPVPGVGVLRKVPRYYENMFAEGSPEEHEKVKQLRKAFRDAHKEEYSSDRLMDKYRVKKAQIKTLTRSYENHETFYV